jgi:hypothetical protein
MSVTITSTTSSDKELAHAVSPEWRTPVEEVREKPRRDVPTDHLSARDFIDKRDNDIADKKSVRDKNPNNGYEKRIKKLTAEKYSLRRELDEARKARETGPATGVSNYSPESSKGTLEAAAPRAPQASRPTAGTPERSSPGSAPSTEPAQREFETKYTADAKRIPDFEKVMTERGETARVPEAAARAIKSVDNPAAVAYFLTVNDSVREQLWNNPAGASEVVAQISQRIKAGDTQRAPNTLESQRVQQLLQSHAARMQTAAERSPEVRQLFKSMQVPPSRQVLFGVLETDNSDAVAIHLARNPQLIAELNGLPPTAAFAKIGRIAEQLESKSRDAAQAKVRVMPPAPISPVGGSASGHNVPLDQMPMRDFMKTRDKQEREWKKRTRR